MDASRPRRSISTHPISYKDDADEIIDDEQDFIKTTRPKRSRPQPPSPASPESALRKRKRDSLSPNEIRHVPLRSGLRGSMDNTFDALPTIERTSRGERRRGTQSGSQSQSTSAETSPEVPPTKIVKLSIRKSAAAQVPAQAPVYMNGDGHGGHGNHGNELQDEVPVNGHGQDEEEEENVHPRARPEYVFDDGGDVNVTSPPQPEDQDDLAAAEAPSSPVHDQEEDEEEETAFDPTNRDSDEIASGKTYLHNLRRSGRKPQPKRIMHAEEDEEESPPEVIRSGTAQRRKSKRLSFEEVEPASSSNRGLKRSGRKHRRSSRDQAHGRRSSKRSQGGGRHREGSRRDAGADDSDFHAEGLSSADEDVSISEESSHSHGNSFVAADDDDDDDLLRSGANRRNSIKTRPQLRARQQINYAIPPPLPEPERESPRPASAPLPRTTFQSLYPSYGSLGLGLSAGAAQQFGGLGFPVHGMQDSSDSSGDEGGGQQNAGGGFGANGGAAVPILQSAAVSSGTGNVGRVKGSNLADADPIGIDKEVSFDSVGGLEDHVNQLKEMVSLPLLYPEIFTNFHITPPRGVLFHGPPGTGKTLMARALAASCSTGTRKIAFYMRKGADCLSKWVGEAERQLRLLFDEAKANQPSIIFFDEIDGLAPVRSAKQDQIHASIVSTLLALMDGMDARGQIVVIGATNRPDSVDPALRRPGRFDREFYFPLPSLAARKQILGIHTGKWQPKPEEAFIAELATQTKGYGGADLRALCTEAALNAVQRRYPQIYQCSEKLVIDPAQINVSARDFMVAVKKIIPSSARSTSSGAAVLPAHIEPLLSGPLAQVVERIDAIVPRRAQQSALQENLSVAQDDSSFDKERMLQQLDRMRVYRPRLLIAGEAGCGQGHLGAAILHHLEGFFVQTLDLSTMFSDSARTPEAALIQAFVEAKRHKPSVLFMPAVELWYSVASPSLRSTLQSLLSSIMPNDPLLLLGIANVGLQDLSHEVRETFGYNDSAIVSLDKVDAAGADRFFGFLCELIVKSPDAYPDGKPPRKRRLEKLAVAPPEQPRLQTRAERKAIEAKDRKLKLLLKAKLGPLVELLRTRYKRFKKPVIDERKLAHLSMEASARMQDMTEQTYVRTEDNMILETTTGKKFHNMDISIIEERLWNNLYMTPRQFIHDVEQVVHDAKEEDDRVKAMAAQEMLTHVLIHTEEMMDAAFMEECKQMALREVERHRKFAEIQQQRRNQAAAEQAAAGEAAAKEAVVMEMAPVEDALAVGDTAAAPLVVGPDPEEEAPAPVLSTDEIAVPQAIVEEDGDTVMAELQTPLLTRSGFPSPGTVNRLLHDYPPKSRGEDPPVRVNGDQAEAQTDNPAHVNEAPPAETSPAAQEALEPVSLTTADVQETMPETPRAETPLPSPNLSPSPSPSPEPEHAPYALDLAALDVCRRTWLRGAAGLTVDDLEQVNASAVDAIWTLRREWDRNIVLKAADKAICRMSEARQAAQRERHHRALHDMD